MLHAFVGASITVYTCAKCREPRMKTPPLWFITKRRSKRTGEYYPLNNTRSILAKMARPLRVLLFPLVILFVASCSGDSQNMDAAQRSHNARGRRLRHERVARWSREGVHGSCPLNSYQIWTFKRLTPIPCYSK